MQDIVGSGRIETFLSLSMLLGQIPNAAFLGNKNSRQVMLIIFILFSGVALSTLSQAADITGPARVVDGDTIHIGKTKIRLHGIDTPETKQECKDANGNPWMVGVEATAFLKSMTEGKEVSCSSHGNDRYGRMIGSCEVDGMDINREMVIAGLARAYRQYSERYLYEEHSAMRNKAGMWGGECMAPWEWRGK